jgi:glycosyltransferase involved in cell wall biosynthesis
LPERARRDFTVIVPAFDEAPVVPDLVRELRDTFERHGMDGWVVLVDDGSTDGTAAAIDAWLPGHDGARRLGFPQNRGMSAAYHLAFTGLRARLDAGELDARDLVLTVDADGQHDLDALDVLERITVTTGLDALIARRDLSGYPAYKRAGNWVMSAWASLCAGRRLHDVESGYRIFRLGALADALDYYRGHRYSETIEVAVVLCRLGYAVRNDVVVPVPIYRSRTRMYDAGVDVVMGIVAALRVGTRRRRRRRGAVTRDQQCDAP